MDAICTGKYGKMHNPTVLCVMKQRNLYNVSVMRLPHLTTGVLFFLAHINIIVYCDDSESFIIATFVTPVKSCFICTIQLCRVAAMPIRWKNQQFTALFCLTLRQLASSLVRWLSSALHFASSSFCAILRYRSIYLLFVSALSSLRTLRLPTKHIHQNENKTKQESCMFHQM